MTKHAMEAFNDALADGMKRFGVDEQKYSYDRAALIEMLDKAMASPAQ